jgi:hypothetical protein
MSCRTWVPWSVAVVTVLAVGPSPAGAQTPAEPARAGNRPAVLRPVKHDTTPPLRDMPPLPIEREEREAPHPPLPVRGGPPAARQEADPKIQTAAPTVGAITPLASFGGIGNLSGVLPPDTNGDVGPSHYVQWVNLNFAVFGKDGSTLYPPTSGRTLWQGFGGPCETQNDGDPIVLYDELADRWFMSQFALPNFPRGPFYQCIAVSTTGSPLGSWHRYEYSFSKLNDYPKFGVWPDGYYMSMNQFTCNLVMCKWAGQGVVAFERSQMLNGGDARAVYFDMASNAALGGMLPADLDGSTPPPAGSPDYYMQFDDQPDELRLWEFHADWSNTASATFTERAVLPTAPFDSNMCNGSRNCIPQPGTAAKIDAIADRLMYRLQYRNFGTYDALVVNHTVDVGSDRGGVRWYEIRNPHTAPAIRQQGTYAPADALNRWMGSAAMDKDGNLAIGYSVSSSQTFPSIRFTGRLAGDPLDTLTVAESDLRQGTGSQTHTSGRWGDYSMLAVDPSDGCTFWYTTEYYNAGATSAGWSTHIGSFKLADCGGTVTPPPNAPSDLTATAASSSEIDLSWADNSSDETEFRIERCQGSGCSSFAQMTVVAPNVTSYSDQSVTADTTYRYRVLAANGTLVSSPSNEAEATTPPGGEPPGVVIHVAGLTGSSSANGRAGWRATVTIEIRDGGNAPVSNATVTGLWSAGYSGSASCTTDGSGTCSVTTTKISNNTPSATFTVTDVAHPTAQYDSSANVVTSVTVSR